MANMITGGNCLTPTLAVLRPCRSGWLFGHSLGLASLLKSKMNVPQVHAKKQQIFCLYFHTDLSCVQGKADVLCVRAENGCGELLSFVCVRWEEGCK